MIEHHLINFIPSFEECERPVDVDKMHHELVLAVEVVVEPREEAAEQQVHQVQDLRIRIYCIILAYQPTDR